MDRETLNEKRNELTEFKTEEMEKQVSELGVTIEQAQLKDLTFPKSIQDLFAKHLEAKIRAKSDLENARTAVATARALKNASELMKDDDNIKFFQFIETITKIAEKGRHTFMIGDLNQLTKKQTMEESTTGNTGFASGGVTCKLGALCFYSSSVLVDSFVLRNPPERKAQNVGGNFKGHTVNKK